MADIRISHQAVEALSQSDAESVLVSQQAVEVLHITTQPLRISQLPVEVLWGPSPDLRVSQQVVEVLRPTPSQFYDCGLPDSTPEDLCNKRLVYAYVEWDVTGSTTVTYES